MSSLLIPRRLRSRDVTERQIARAPKPPRIRARTASMPAPAARNARRAPEVAPRARFVIALVPMGAGNGSREKRYLARRNGRTFFVAHTREAMMYATYKTAHMIGIKAAVHYNCVACIEEL